MNEIVNEKIKELRQELIDLRNNGAEIEDIANLIYTIQLEENKIKYKEINNE